MTAKGLLQRFKCNETVLIAEGYLWELERRGFVKSGSFAPEVVIDNPKYLRNLHEEFVLAGSDVVEAYTYFGHREKLKTIGREDDVENLNRAALRIARDVASSYGKLMAGNISNTWMYATATNGLKAAEETMTAMFKEQIEWAVEEGSDYIIGETFADLREALLALKCIKQYGNDSLLRRQPKITDTTLTIASGNGIMTFNCMKGNVMNVTSGTRGCPAVITLTAFVPEHTFDGVPFPEACRKLEEAGADVVGLNCGRGPATMMPLIKEIKKVCKGPVAAIPVPFRTREDCKSFQSLIDKETGKPVHPLDSDCLRCCRSEVRQFAVDAKEAGVDYVGFCCGNAPNFMREVAEVFDRKPPASLYSPDISRSVVYGKDVSPATIKIREHIAGKYVGSMYQ